MCRPHVVVSVVAGCTARMRESLNIFEVLTDFIYDSAWASDHYALVRGRFTITKSGKRVHCAFLEQSKFRQTRLVDQVKQGLVIHE